jgi:nucleotide-binding universal stress UspA family protein
MITFKRIVVGIDFNEPSLAALEYARSLAASFGGSVSVIHVIPPVPTEVFTYSREMVENWERTAYERLWTLFPAAERTARQGRVEVRIGPPVDEILTFADERNADLIILGTHGRGPLTHLFLGSVAERVVRRARCPVLTVGQAAAAAAGFRVAEAAVATT